MRLMLMWADNAPEMKILIECLEKAGHEIVYWVGLNGGEHMCPSGAIFHDHYDAWDGKPAAKYASAPFAPASAVLVQEMRETESITLTMMNKRFDALCVDERRHIYYAMLSYWSGILDRLKPDAILFPSVPHSVYNFILYELARKRGIETIMFEQSWVSDRLLMYHDFEEGSRGLRIAMEKNKNADISEEDLSDDLQKYVREQREVQPVPIYVTEYKRSDQFWRKMKTRARGAWSSVMRGAILKEAERFLRKYIGENLKKEYEAYVSGVPVDGTPFVYIPLSFQPERTSSPQGGLYVDQILIVETVSAALPDGWVVVVKEHPVQWSLRSGIAYSSARYRGFYRRIAAIPNVVLAPIDWSSAELLRDAIAVASSSGSAGGEALMRGKPVLNFGYPWYRDCPGAFRVKGVDSCREIIEKIRNGHVVAQADTLKFLKSFDEASYHICMESLMEDRETHTPGEKMELLGEIIVRELSGALRVNGI